MRGKRGNKQQYYTGRRSARMGFLAGVGTCLMLIAAAACVAFAVYMMIDTRTPAQARGVHHAAPTLGTPSVATGEESDGRSVIFEHDDYAERGTETAAFTQTVTPEEYEEIIAPMPTPAPYVSSEPAPPIPEEYRALPFYISDNSGVYAAFAQERPDLDMETVIWKVNASVHVPFYSQIRVNYQPNPLFITPAYRLPYGFSPGELVPVNHDGCHLRALPQAVEAFHLLRATAREAGYDLSVTSAFRSATRQSELWVNGGRRDGRVARPYHSEHQTGRALDLWGPGGLLDAGGPSPTGRWVAANAHYYGFIVRYRAETTHITGYIHEPWHITYVGVDIAMYMHTNDILSLEEFVGRNPGAGLWF